MHVRTNFRIRRGDCTLAEASQATGINRGVLSRIERGEQFPKAAFARILAAFYDPDTLRLWGAEAGAPPWLFLIRCYPLTVLRCLQLERNCACGCGKSLPPDSLKTKRYCDGHRRHRRVSS